jgi:hypothetical protein
MAAMTQTNDKVDMLIGITTASRYVNCVPQQRHEKWHMAIIRELGYRKVYTRWGPKMLTSNTKQVKTISVQNSPVQ